MTSSCTIWYAVSGSISPSGSRCLGTSTMPARVNRGTAAASSLTCCPVLLHTPMTSSGPRGSAHRQPSGGHRAPHPTGVIPARARAAALGPDP